jgi:malonyl-CoA O-methyltransferase
MDNSALLTKNNFSNNAYNYSSNANIQKYFSEKLVNFIKNYKNDLSGLNILDLGCGTGFISDQLQQKFSDNYNLFQLDLSLEMLKFNNSANRICGDFNCLPFAYNSFDLIISSFSLQWCDDFNKILQNLKLILKPNGILGIALPTSESFKNLINCPFQINILPNHLEIMNYLNQNNFNLILQNYESYIENFNNPIDAIKSFKKIGANNLQEKKLIHSFRDLKNFYLINYKFNLSFKLDWVISYFIYLNHV